MGITRDSLNRLERHGLLKPCDMLELGAQNMYSREHYGSIAKDYFERLGLRHTSWDITAHQGAIARDLRDNIPVESLYDIITDYGTSEHVSGNYYQVHLNIHNHCMAGGIIVHENPKTGHWPGHGCNYVTVEFYKQLAQLCNYEILELTEEFAMGNTIDGCNICVVMKKKYESPFITEEEFNTLDFYGK